jgi:hypothetical protein
MRKKQPIGRTRRTFRMLVLLTVLLIVFGTAGYSCAPKLTAEDRRQDIDYLARWAKNYSPFVELNQKYKGLPGVIEMEPTYKKYAEQAQGNQEFLQVILGYYDLIAASGHEQLLPATDLFARELHSLLSRDPSGISFLQFHDASYWPKLYEDSCVVHAPFGVLRGPGGYRTADDWQSKGISIPRGSRIVMVNGMTPSDYLQHLRATSWLRYAPRDIDWLMKYLLVINEGGAFSGWLLDVQMPGGSFLQAHVPCESGSPQARATDFTEWSKHANCVCLELTKEVGYIRVKSMLSNFIKTDGSKIKHFLGKSDNMYRKLIIDIRDNPGGSPYYFYDNLIRPFLDQPTTYKQTAGLKRKFVADFPALIQHLRNGVSIWAWETDIREVPPPSGFDGNEWIFYEITRTIQPDDRYRFHGHLYVLTNSGCFSAAEDYVTAIKRIGLASLVGRTTGGGAAGYIAPFIVRLPASGIIVVLEADLVLNPDGTFDELDGTKPDLELAPCELPEKVTKEELLRDEWIGKIIEESVRGKMAVDDLNQNAWLVETNGERKGRPN